MTNEQILKKAIEKANVEEWNEFLRTEGIEYTIRFVNEIIFSHDFAKAFWGKERINENGIKVSDEFKDLLFAWQYRLQQMVLEKEPLKYLEKFL